MKTLKQLLSESKKTYPFKLGVAGELPEGFDNKLKDALGKFGLESLSAGKKTPIQTHPLDFPKLENMEVTYWDIVLNYPTTDGVLREYLGNFCTVHDSNILVRNALDPVNRQEQLDGDDSPYEALLTKEDPDCESAQESVGDGRVMELLKELEKARKERDMGESGFSIEAPKTETENNKSMIGK
jgi:hypothetical protein